KDQNDHQRARESFLAILAERVKIRSVLRKANGAGGQTERRLNQGLPYKEKRHEAAHATRAVRFAEEDVASTSERHGRAKLRPNETVEQGEERPCNPREQTLRAAHGFNDQGHYNEGADAHHFD